MKVQFKGTPILPTYQAMGVDRKIYNFNFDGEYDLNEVVAKRFIEKRPEMFTDKIPVKIPIKKLVPEVIIEKKPEPIFVKEIPKKKVVVRRKKVKNG